MTNDDPKSDAPSPKWSPAPNDAFTQAMSGVKTRCQHLATAINDHDFEGVMSLAQSATNMWLAGRAACRRLAKRNKLRSPYIEAARLLLEQNYIAILKMFVHATTLIAVPRMARVLADMRGTLMQAMAEPLTAMATVESDKSDKRKPT